MALTAQEARDVAPLKTWAAPLHWHANQAEQEAIAMNAPHLKFSATAVSTDALTFVAITPCRLVDTRGIVHGFDGISPFSGPSITGGGTATFPLQSANEASTTTPAPCGFIPSSVQAYSLNLAVVPHAGGVAGFVTLWPSGATKPIVATLNDPGGIVLDNAAIVAAGTPSGGISVYNSGPATIDVIIDMNGYFAAPTDTNQNTTIGEFALENNTTGAYNTGTGYLALYQNTIGTANTASGAGTLAQNGSGDNNTAIGFNALTGNLTGSGNTGGGSGALFRNSLGNYNTATGNSALLNNTMGSFNTASGYAALQNNSTGNGNIGLGNGAGSNAPIGNNNSVYIGSAGSDNDSSGTVRIGDSGTQSSFFVAAVRAVTTGNNDAIPVVIDSNGQLGTVSSSLRFKEDILDMGEASTNLMRLRPVTYRYKRAYEDGSKPMDYGLIAEEVAEVYPDLVVKGKDGQIETVQYQKLTPMLLNEVQKQHAEVQKLHSELDQQHQRAEQQDETIRQLQARLAALEALVPANVPTAATLGR